MADQMPPADLFIKTYQFTKTLYRDVYPSVDPTSPKLSQEGKVIMVTGSSQGIGQAIAVGFAKANAAGIVLIARNASKLEETKALIAAVNSKTKVLIVPTDVASEKDIEALEAAVKAEFGTAHVLVNVHGVWGGGGLIGTAPVSSWWRDFEVNVKGNYAVTGAFLHLLGKEEQGSIINVSSFGAMMVAPGGSSYGITKFALNRLTEFVALENPNVVTVALHPGTCATSILDDHPEFTPFAVDTLELAQGATVYLTTKDAAFLNGRFVFANWSVDELEAKKEEIVEKDLLKFAIKAEFGPQL